jgi:hypothetical protein
MEAGSPPRLAVERLVGGAPANPATSTENANTRKRHRQEPQVPGKFTCSVRITRDSERAALIFIIVSQGVTFLRYRFNGGPVWPEIQIRAMHYTVICPQG